ELKPSFVGDIEIVLPSKDVQQVFKSVAGPLRDKVVQNQSESQTLAELRDTLLPKIMSGKIRVADAKREVEAAV
ncbi:restriction endonuclease subunit S, partial [Pseudomonadales bacterium]|nr:restriction endonuclease subunit S [Pseudomonadales bacterium]